MVSRGGPTVPGRAGTLGRQLRPNGGSDDDWNRALAYPSDIDADARRRTRGPILPGHAGPAVPLCGPATPGLLRLRRRAADAVHSGAGVRSPWLGCLLRGR